MNKPGRHKGIQVLTWWLILSFAAAALPLRAQPPPGFPPAPETEAPAPSSEPAGDQDLISLNFRDAPIDQLLQFYSEQVNRILLRAQGLPGGTITLKSDTRLSRRDALDAIESVLAMNQVALVPMGEKFLKVVPIGNVRGEGMKLGLEMPEAAFPENDQLVSQVVPLKYIEPAEANTILASFLHAAFGKVQVLERTNSLLITDTASNMQRILEILAYVDQPTVTDVIVRIFPIHHVEASKLASSLNELIAESQAKEEKPRVATVAPAVPTPPGVIRARQAGAGGATEQDIEAALAERGMVQGKVKIVADDRTNILIIMSKPANFKFFEDIINALDQEVNPEVEVKVLPLEFAKAKDIAGILNEFIGAATSESKDAPAAATGQTPAEGTTPEAARSQALQEFVAQRAEARMRQIAAGEKTRIGELSPNTKILADERTNALLLMGPVNDIKTLMEIIQQLDTMLAQVLIEAVILEVSLTKSLDYGVDWLQRSMAVYEDRNAGANGGVTVSQPLYSFGGGQRLNDGTVYKDGSQITRSDSGIGAGGLTYYTTLVNLNIDAVIRMAAGSSDARILSTPVILTTDNTEATIVVGEERPVVTSTSTSSGGQQTSSYEYRNIGIDLTVTPRINPARFVTMEIKQSADNVGGFELIDGNRVPVITKREMAAQVAVGDRSTIVLGGLVSNDRRASRVKVPILGDIPLLGTLFRADTRNDNRTELLVLMTPYVLMDQDEAKKETARLHRATRYSQTRWQRGWSDSELAGPAKTRELKQAPALLDDPGTRKPRKAKKADEAPAEAPKAAAEAAPATNAPPPAHFIVTVPEDISSSLFSSPAPAGDAGAEAAPEGGGEDPNAPVPP
ncbi:MAG TPA: type II secretion system secretin GspD [Kiritimatiellia bacterium]|nr:type II secretion system secretin GspD [Kiritimatiellia bacterium]HSA18868.1 type II secretion system secretin GspD [Kiritimatiellia bacterium]